MLSERVSDLEGTCVVYHGHTICTARGESFTIVRKLDNIYFSFAFVQFKSDLKRKLCPIAHMIGE